MVAGQNRQCPKAKHLIPLTYSKAFAVRIKGMTMGSPSFLPAFFFEITDELPENCHFLTDIAGSHIDRTIMVEPKAMGNDAQVVNNYVYDMP